MDFVYGDVTEDNLLAVCGTDGYKSNLRIITKRDHYVANCNLEEGKFTQVRFVRTNKSKINGLVVGSEKGNLLIFSFPFYERILD